jgi:hypothetical protein
VRKDSVAEAGDGPVVIRKRIPFAHDRVLVEL